MLLGFACWAEWAWRVCARAEFTGFEEQTGPLNLPRDSDRIWRGSYKGKDWRYLVCSPSARGYTCNPVKSAVCGISIGSSKDN